MKYEYVKNGVLFSACNGFGRLTVNALDSHFWQKRASSHFMALNDSSIALCGLAGIERNHPSGCSMNHEVVASLVTCFCGG